eukprot:SAG31_NODE_37427_length_304_cov_0.975610_1_plen_44_part_10
MCLCTLYWSLLPAWYRRGGTPDQGCQYHGSEQGGRAIEQGGRAI